MHFNFSTTLYSMQVKSMMTSTKSSVLSISIPKRSFKKILLVLHSTLSREKVRVRAHAHSEQCFATKILNATVEMHRCFLYLPRRALVGPAKHLSECLFLHRRKRRSWRDWPRRAYYTQLRNVHPARPDFSFASCGSQPCLPV